MGSSPIFYSTKKFGGSASKLLKLYTAKLLTKSLILANIYKILGKNREFYLITQLKWVNFMDKETIVNHYRVFSSIVVHSL